MLHLALLAAALSTAEPQDLLCTFERGGKTYADRLTIDLAAGRWRHPLRNEAARAIAGVEEGRIVLRDETQTRRGLPDFRTREWIELADTSYHYAAASADGYAVGAMTFACQPVAFTPFPAG